MPLPGDHQRLISRRSFLAAALTSGAFSLPAQDRRPNFLVLLSDQQHWQALGFMDRFFHTPHLDRLAAASFAFERGFCVTPQCSPSRSALLTGFYPTKTGVIGNVGAAGGNELRMKTVGARLQEGGYHTGYFGKWHLGENPAATAGWDVEWRKQEDAAVTRRAVEFLNSAGAAQRPFALFLSHLDPHDIYQYRPVRKDVSGLSVPLSASWHRETFRNKPSVQKEFMTSDQGRVIWGRPQRDWEEYRDFYRGKVALYDAHAGEVLEALRGNGFWDNTIVIMSSDHGDMDANHKLIFKGPFMYEHMVRVPMIVRVPEALGGAGARRVKDYDAVNVDVVPTILDFAGLPPVAGDGLSLKPILTGARGKKRDFVIGQYYSKQTWVNPIRMIRTAEYKYNRYIDHGEELYDLKNDPEEIVNLAGDPKRRKVQQELRAELDRWIASNKDPFDTYKTTRLSGGRRQ